MLVNFENFAIDIDRIFEIRKIIKGGFFNKKHYVSIVTSESIYCIKCKNKQSCDIEYDRIIKIYYENKRNTKGV